MAQRSRRGGGRRFGDWARRLGARPGVLACMVMLAVTCAVGVGVALHSAGGFEVVRGEEVADPDASQDTATMTGTAPEASGAGDAADGVGAADEVIVVHVDGAVVCPGVYELAGAGPRVGDAVAAAGGLADDADTTGVNLAAKVTDGTKVYVPRQGEAASTASTAETGASASGAGGLERGASGGLVNINTATSDELQTLSGIGEATARAIIEDRERNGPFATVEDLMRVSGIGEKKFAKLEGSICV